jgi:hypothetical protein
MAYGDKKDSKPKIGFNLILVRNGCEDKCSQIHHWLYLTILLFLYFGINYLIGFGYNKNYPYIISIYLGVCLSELVKFRTEIFKFKKPCCIK